MILITNFYLGTYQCCCFYYMSKHEILERIAFSSREGSRKSVQIRRLAKAFNACIHNLLMIETKTKIRPSLIAYISNFYWTLKLDLEHVLHV